MRNARRVLKVSRLSPQALQRLILCLNGKAVPHPIWQHSDEPDTRPRVFLIAGPILLIALFFIGGDAAQSPAWLVLWMIATGLTGWGFFAWWKTRREAAALPIAPGTYLFATDLIDVRDGSCSFVDLDQILEVRGKPNRLPGKAGQWELEFALPGQIVKRPVAGKQAAERVIRDFWSAKENHLAAVSTADWNAVAAWDPLYEPRYGGAWEQLHSYATVPETPGSVGDTGWFGLHRSVVRAGIITALLLGPALWFASNAVRDELAFQRAQSANTVLGWQRYLSRSNPAKADRVRGSLLPSVALKEAKKLGTASAYREFLTKHGSSSVAPEARALLRGEYEAAAEAAVRQLRPEPAAALVALLKWQEEHQRTAVDVRFAPSSEAALSGFDDFIAFVTARLGTRLRGVDFPPIAPAFAGPVIKQRQEAIVALFRRGLSTYIPQSLVLPQRGGDFSGEVKAFDQPAFAVEWVAEPAIEEGVPMTPIIGSNQKDVYLPLRFRCRVSLAVPSQKPYTLEFSMQPGDYIPETFSGKSYYERMMEIAFEELNYQIAQAFFPAVEIKRSFSDKKITRATATPPAAVPAAAMQRSATGFCVSNAGHIATAKHFTEGARDFKVITSDGTFDATLVKEDPRNDLAILKVASAANWKIPPIPLRSSASVRLLETIWTVGYPQTQLQGVAPKATGGQINSLSGLLDDPACFQVNAVVDSGSSGGALLDEFGNAIGVVVGMARGTSSGLVNYAVKSDLLINLIKTIQDHGALAAPYPPMPEIKTTTGERAVRATVRLEAIK